MDSAVRLMEANVNNDKVLFLKRYMELFEIDHFEVLEINELGIRGIVRWDDDGSLYYDESEEIQEIFWKIKEGDNLNEMILLIGYLIKESLIDMDKIIISERELTAKLIKDFKWENLKIVKIIRCLGNIEVDMIDDGLVTDSYFIHF